MSTFVVRLASLVFPALLLADGREIGIVIRTEGSWFDQRYKNAVTELYPVREDSQIIRSDQGDDHAFLWIRFIVSPNKPEIFDCAQSLVCKDSLDLADRLNNLPKKSQRSAASQFLKAVSEFLAGNGSVHESYAHAISRTKNPDRPSLAAAVLPITPRGIDVSKAFRRFEPGTYKLDLSSVDASGVPTSKPQVSEFVWEPPRSSIWTRDSVVPGLYALSVCEDVEGTLMRKDAVLVLLASDRDYRMLRAKFDKASSIVRTWSDTPTADLLSAYLGVLRVSEGR